MKNSSEENRSTDRPQTPRECKHFKDGYCPFSVRTIRTLEGELIRYAQCDDDCPDFTPKTKEKS